MRFENYINEDLLVENIIMKSLRKLFSKPSKKVMMIFQNSFKKFIKWANQESLDVQILKILNQQAMKNYDSLEKILKERPIVEGEMNEDWAHFWDTIKGEAFPSLSFYPALQIWLEIDKLIKGSDASTKTMIVYAIIWFLLVSGKFVKHFYKWKKENPEEYNTERQGRKGLMA